MYVCVNIRAFRIMSRTAYYYLAFLPLFVLALVSDEGWVVEVERTHLVRKQGRHHVPRGGIRTTYTDVCRQPHAAQIIFYASNGYMRAFVDVPWHDLLLALLQHRAPLVAGLPTFFLYRSRNKVSSACISENRAHICRLDGGFLGAAFALFAASPLLAARRTLQRHHPVLLIISASTATAPTTPGRSESEI
jgi:uncharacterized membrane protein